jgi:prepilin-type processing-associated H-X9-DG protein
VEELESGYMKLRVKKGTTAYDHTLVDLRSNTPLIRIGPSWTEHLVQGSFSSYGLNAATPNKIIGHQAVLAMDYEKSLADVVDAHSTEAVKWWTDWANDEDIPYFARHLGQANVLFGDGGVKAIDPESIDPCVTELRERLWQP